MFLFVFLCVRRFLMVFRSPPRHRPPSSHSMRIVGAANTDFSPSSSKELIYRTGRHQHHVQFDDIPTVESSQFAPVNMPKVPTVRPLRAGVSPERRPEIAPASASPRVTAPVNVPRPTQRPKTPRVLPAFPGSSDGELALSPNFPFRDVEYVEVLLELQQCTVPYTWYAQKSVAEPSVVHQFDQAVRAALLGMLAKRIPILLRDMWVEILPGVATSLHLKVEGDRLVIADARWPMRLLVALRVSGNTPSSLLVHALQDLVQSRPVLSEPMKLLEKLAKTSAGSGDLTLIETNTFATSLMKTEEQ